MIIDGKKIAQEIIIELKKKPQPQKFLAAILVGNNLASVSFLKQKERVAQELGVDFKLCTFPSSILIDELKKEILKIIETQTCGGVIIQLPLPENLEKQTLLNLIPQEKDVDVLGEKALGTFYTGRSMVLPPAVGTIQTILKTLNIQLSTSKVVIIGRGVLVGKPIAAWLMDKVAELSVFASTTKNIKNKLKDADVTISGVGNSGLFGPEDLKENAFVIDFGYDMVNGKITGDFDSSNLAHEHTSTLVYTPTPGGTGPVLVAKLFENFFKLAKSQEK